MGAHPARAAPPKAARARRRVPGVSGERHPGPEARRRSRRRATTPSPTKPGAVVAVSAAMPEDRPKISDRWHGGPARSRNADPGHGRGRGGVPEPSELRGGKKRFAPVQHGPSAEPANGRQGTGPFRETSTPRAGQARVRTLWGRPGAVDNRKRAGRERREATNTTRKTAKRNQRVLWPTDAWRRAPAKRSYPAAPASRAGRGPVDDLNQVAGDGGGQTATGGEERNETRPHRRNAGEGTRSRVDGR